MHLEHREWGRLVILDSRVLRVLGELDRVVQCRAFLREESALVERSVLLLVQPARRGLLRDEGDRG